MNLLSRFPSFKENIRVYALIVTVLYTWTTLWLFWELPSWLYFLSLGEILPVFAYALVTNFLESALVLLVLNALSFFLPVRWFRTEFVARGAMIVALGAAFLMYFASLFGKEAEFPTELLMVAPMVFLTIFSVSFFLSGFALVRKTIEGVADRLVIFLYLTVPLSLISAIVVFVRNAR